MIKKSLNFARTYKYVFLLALLLLTLLPFLLISLYVNPTDDDFCNASSVMDIGAFNYMKYLYFNHTGRYASTIILSTLNPLLQNNWLLAVKIYPVIYFALFISAFYLFIHSFIKTQLVKKIIYTLAFTAIILSNIPSVASSFYWFTGFTVYTFGIILCLLFIAAYISYERTKQFIYLAVALLLMIAIVGTCEIFIPVILILLGYSFVIKKINREKTSYSILVLSSILIVFTVLTLSAPGNMARAQHASSQVTQALPMVFIKASIKNFYLVLSHLISWLTDIKIYLAALLFVPISISFGLLNENKQKQLPVLVNIAVVFFLVFSITFLPCLVDNEVLPRVWNVAYVFFLIGLFSILHFYIQTNKEKALIIYSYLPPDKSFYLWSFLIALLLLSSKSNINNAYIDFLAKGKEFDSRLKLRYETIAQQRSKGADEIKLEAIFDRTYKYPKTLYLSDITESPELYPNNCYSNYFKIKKMSLVKSNRLEPFHMKEAW